MAVNVFGLGTLLPNNFADQATVQQSEVAAIH